MWYKFLPRRFDRQVALICAALMLCTIPFYVIHEANEELEFIFENAKRETKVIAQNIAVNSIDHVITRDYTSLENLLIHSAKFPGIIDIQVANPSGKIISDIVAEGGNDTDAKPRYSVDAIDVPSKVMLQLFEKKNEDRMIIWAPIKSGSQLGWVKINYSLAGARKHEAERLADYFVDGVVLTLVLSVLLMLSMRRPLRMIENAVEFAARLDEKAGEQLPVIRHSVEIEKLFEVLNKTSLNLAEQDAKIKKGVKDLETQKHALDEHSIVTITDVNGNITYANDKLLSTTGFKLEELLGKNPSILSSGYHSKAFYKSLWDTISQGKPWHGEIADKDKQGNRIWMQTTIVPFLDNNGSPYEYVAIQSDITAQKETESLLDVKNKALELLTKKLETKVKSRTAELEKANSELVHLNNVKSEFVSIVSHELRTPLTAIKSFAEILEDDFDDMDKESRRKYISIINEESLRLSNLINDVLDLQKIDSGKMTWNIEKTELNKLASTTIELFSKSYKDKGLDLYFSASEDKLFADVDSDKIKQVLSNLLSNAYKFTAAGSVTLEIKKIIQHPTVLVVDDDESVRLCLEVFIKDVGVEVIMCSCARDALDVLQDDHRKIDLLITDIMMPDMNGVELIKEVRSTNKNIPIVVISSSSDDDILKSLLDYNITGFIDKPFQPDVIAMVIKKVFGDIQHSNQDIPMVEITVSDTGLGIPEDELSKVFQRFHQVDSSETREIGGSGLGLSICQDIIKQHHGTLWVTSIMGKGSRFSFNLPLSVNEINKS